MPISLRSLAATDIDSALAYYRTQAGQDIALNFISDLETALDHIEHYPLTGSLRFAYELEIPNLRSWTLSTFPYMIFYITNQTGTEVWRILHAKRDIPDFLIQDQSS